MGLDFPFLFDTMGSLLAALPVTLALFVLSISFGAVLALLLTAMRVSGHVVLDRIARAYVFVFRGSPLLIQMFLVYYGVAQFAAVRHSFIWPIMRDPFFCAVISLALCTAAYAAEIFRGGILAVPAAQIEAARACGMSGLLLLRRIIAPIALRQALPAYSTELILMVKSTSLASILTVTEVSGVAQRIISHTYRTMEVFLCAALIYLLINFIIARLIAWLEHALSPHLRVQPLAQIATGAAFPLETTTLH
jgi:octopine/nopaline transport system permease protein